MSFGLRDPKKTNQQLECETGQLSAPPSHRGEEAKEEVEGKCSGDSVVSQQPGPLPYLPCPSGRGAARLVPACSNGEALLSQVFPASTGLCYNPEKTISLRSGFPETTLPKKLVEFQPGTFWPTLGHPQSDPPSTPSPRQCPGAPGQHKLTLIPLSQDPNFHWLWDKGSIFPYAGEQTEPQGQVPWEPRVKANFIFPIY